MLPNAGLDKFISTLSQIARLIEKQLETFLFLSFCFLFFIT